MDLIIALLAALASAPIIFGNVIGCCCGCFYCSDSTPTSYQVVIAGIVDDACSECASVNGTFVLETTPSEDGCVWKYDFEGEICEGGGFIYGTATSIYLFSQDGQFQCQVWAGGGAQRITWIHTYPSQKHTCEESSLGLAYVSNGWPACIASGSTCTITAL